MRAFCNRGIDCLLKVISIKRVLADVSIPFRRGFVVRHAKQLRSGTTQAARRLYPDFRTVAGRIVPLRFNVCSIGLARACWIFLHQTIADAGFRDQVPRSSRVGFDLASKSSHIDSQILVLMDRIRAPDFFQKRTTVQRSIHRVPTWSRKPSVGNGIVPTGSRGNASYRAEPRARRKDPQY